MHAICTSFDSLGQWCSLQARTSVLSPSHGAPPYISARNSRDLIWIPPPHSWEQSPHSVQGSHSQSTGQCSRKQTRISLWGPLQSLPLYWGTGLVQVRVLVSVPLSQEVLHLLNSVHSVQPPSTAEKEQYSIWTKVPFLSLILYPHTLRYLSLSLSLILHHSLGQWWVLHSLISTVRPVQSSSWAPWVLHSLFLLCRPPPHDTPHSVQLLHSLQEFGGIGMGLLSVLLAWRASRVSGCSANVAVLLKAARKTKHKIAYANTDYNTKIILQIVSNLGYIELHAVNLLQFLQHSPGSLYGAFPSAHTVISLQVCTTARSSPVVCRTSEKLNTTVCLYTTSNLRHRRKKCKDRWRTALSSPRLWEPYCPLQASPPRNSGRSAQDIENGGYNTELQSSRDYACAPFDLQHEVFFPVHDLPTHLLFEVERLWKYKREKERRIMRFMHKTVWLHLVRMWVPHRQRVSPSAATSSTNGRDARILSQKRRKPVENDRKTAGRLRQPPALAAFIVPRFLRPLDRSRSSFARMRYFPQMLSHVRPAEGRPVSQRENIKKHVHVISNEDSMHGVAK